MVESLPVAVQSGYEMIQVELLQGGVHELRVALRIGQRMGPSPLGVGVLP